MNSTTLPLDRNNLEVLDLETCLDLAGSVPIARVAVNGPGSPIVLPVTHVVIDAKVAFRSASGSKLDAAIMAKPITVEADQWDLATRTGWSVVFRGTAETLHDPELEKRLAGLVEEPWIGSSRPMQWIVVRVNEVSGRRIPPPADA